MEEEEFEVTLTILCGDAQPNYVEPRPYRSDATLADVATDESAALARFAAEANPLEQLWLLRNGAKAPPCQQPHLSSEEREMLADELGGDEEADEDEHERTAREQERQKDLQEEMDEAWEEEEEPGVYYHYGFAAYVWMVDAEGRRRLFVVELNGAMAPEAPAWAQQAAEGRGFGTQLLAMAAFDDEMWTSADEYLYSFDLHVRASNAPGIRLYDARRILEDERYDTQGKQEKAGVYQIDDKDVGKVQYRSRDHKELCDDLENHRAVEWLRAADDRQDGDVVVMEYESLDDIKTNGGVFWEKVKEMTLYEHQQKVSRARRPRARRDPPQVRCGTPLPPYIGGLRQRGSRRAVRGRP